MGRMGNKPLLDATSEFAALDDLHATGMEMMRCNLERKFPEAPPEEIEQRLELWLRRFDPKAWPGFTVRRFEVA